MKKNLILVIVRYYDGSTFGRTCGYWEIIKATNNHNDAMQIKEQIEQDKWTGGHCYWKGYFAGLERVQIEVLPVIG